MARTLVNKLCQIKENFTNLGYKEEKINKMIKRYDEAGVLDEEAEDALELLKEYNEANKQKLLDNQKDYAIKQEEQQQFFQSSVQDSIKDLDKILGMKISEKEKKDTLDYILVADKSGMTGFQREMLEDIKKFVTSAYYTKNGVTVPNRMKKQGETNAVKDLHKKIKANKGNSATGSGDPKSGGSADGLSLLSSMLRK